MYYSINDNHKFKVEKSSSYKSTQLISQLDNSWEKNFTMGKE